MVGRLTIVAVASFGLGAVVEPEHDASKIVAGIAVAGTEVQLRHPHMG